MTETTAPGIAALDRLSGQLLRAASDLRVAVATSEADREDAYDADALHVGAWTGDALAGTLRLVLPRPGRCLPVEEAFGIEIAPAGAVAEAGRLVVAPEQRGDPAHRIWGGLFARAWLELRSHGLAVLAGTAAPRMVGRLRALGLPFEVLAPARPYWGEQRHPVRLDPSHSRPRWF
jgi:hypothetical protein